MKLRVLQWNILYSEPLDRIAAVIKTIDPDVACLQELLQDGDHDAGRTLNQRLGYHAHYSYRPFIFSDRASGQLGNGIFSKHPLTAKRGIDILSYRLNDHQVGFDYLEASIKVGPTTVTLGTLHPPFRPSFYTTKTKQKLLTKLLPQIEAATTPYILTGDFNAPPTSAMMAEIKRRLRYGGPAYRLPTWTKFPQTIANHDFAGMNWRLDYVFYKGDLRVTSSQILDVAPSDHAPVLVEFEL